MNSKDPTIERQGLPLCNTGHDDVDILAGCRVRSLSTCLLTITTVTVLASQIDSLCPHHILYPSARQHRGGPPPPSPPPPLITRDHHLVWLSGKKTGHNSSVGSWFGQRLATLSTMLSHRQWAEHNDCAAGGGRWCV